MKLCYFDTKVPVQHGDSCNYLGINPKTGKPAFIDALVLTGCNDRTRPKPPPVHGSVIVDLARLPLEQIETLAKDAALARGKRHYKRLINNWYKFFTPSAYCAVKGTGFVQIGASGDGVCVWGFDPAKLAHDHPQKRPERVYEVYRVKTNQAHKILACEIAAGYIGMKYDWFIYVKVGIAAALCNPRLMALEPPIQKETRKVCTEVFADCYLEAAMRAEIQDWFDFFRVRITCSNLPTWCKGDVCEKVLTPSYQHLPAPWLLTSPKLKMVWRDSKDWARVKEVA